MPGKIDKQYAIRCLRLPADADEARIAKAVRGMARRHGRMRRYFAEHPDLDLAASLAAVEERLTKEEKRLIALNIKLGDLIAKRKQDLHIAGLVVWSLRVILSSCYAPDEREPEE